VTSAPDMFSLYSQAESAWRLETRKRYRVPAETARIRAFSEGRPLPADPAVTRTLQVIRAAHDAGRLISRTHVVDLPLSPYLRYRMRVDRENVEAGEQVSIAVRSWHPDLAGLTEDCVLFDAETPRPAVVWMRYGDDDQIVGREYSESPADIARACHFRRIVAAHAVPLDEFTATLADTG
jgi:hypothetical protein